MSEWAIWGALLVALDIMLATGVTIHAVLIKRDTRAVIAWVGLAWLTPMLGALAYVCFGINRIERKGESFKLQEIARSLQPEDKSQSERLQREHPNLVGLALAGRRLTGLPVIPGNHVEPLIDGDQAYPRMIGAIHRAERSISLLSYIFDSDRVGLEFRDALVAAQKRGVAVRVLIDHVGSRYSRPSMATQLRAAGITTATFLPTRIPRLPTYANLRNHRKILVVDGQVGFTGGTNIREGHCLQLKPKHPVQCLHFELCGPVIEQLQRVFCVDWAFTTGERLEGDAWFPKLQRAGQIWARSVENGPDNQFEKLADMIVAALASARQRVRVLTPYFLPNASLIQSLNVAAMRGVEVEIFMPAANNIPVVQWAATAQLGQILEKGCRVFYTQPPFDHTKLMIVDGVWALIGSTNWDPRSLRLNFEFNVECYSQALAQTLNQIVDRKARTAREVTMDQINGRTLPVRLRDGLARLLTPYL